MRDSACSPSMSVARPRVPTWSIDKPGNCLGHGRNRGGNPASNNPDFAGGVRDHFSAVEAAVADRRRLGHSTSLVAQIAPRRACRRMWRWRRLETAFRAAWPQRAHRLRRRSPGDVRFGHAGDGRLLRRRRHRAQGVIRVRGGVDRPKVVDLAGWLLGDLGSGYWLGHEAAKAVTAELDGRGEADGR